MHVFKLLICCIFCRLCVVRGGLLTVALQMLVATVFLLGHLRVGSGHREGFDG